jgi:hypothetical protein
MNLYDVVNIFKEREFPEFEDLKKAWYEASPCLRCMLLTKSNMAPKINASTKGPLSCVNKMGLMKFTKVLYTKLLKYWDVRYGHIKQS